MKNQNKYKESSYLNYWNIKCLYGRAISQKLSVNDFRWIGDTSQFTKDVIENYNKDKVDGYFLEVDVQYPKNLNNLHNDLHFLHERIH